ncbi:MAG TPA: SDR family NAD(P)-dependent oxidoreductase [Thermoanaerobaculia bacterium]|jgi:NAD(P)-dependent dehydrogenase (short-subunit alcohol dehydrogenase family)|nr:SDR family NAD(P)-dependent oxidoreductase [Thermoanaerobaculia bacterium]
MQDGAFHGRVAIVTGAGKGIGQATAIAFSKLGAAVVLCSQSKGPLMETLALIERSGGKAMPVVGDVSSESVAEETVAMALKEFGRLDFAVNNAGISPWTSNTVDCTFETWQRVIGVNLTGTWLGMKYQIPAMLKTGRGGAIVNMTSVAALQVFEGYPVYSASKWGVVGLSKVAAREFASRGVRVNTIAPGSVDTPLFSTVVNSTPTSRAHYEKQTPMGRIAKSEEVAAAATWLCSDAASYVTGAVLPVDGGLTL